MIPSQPPRGRSAAPSGAVAPGAALARPLPWGWCRASGFPFGGRRRFWSPRRARWLAALPSACLFGLGVLGGWWPLFGLVERPFLKAAVQ